MGIESEKLQKLYPLESMRPEHLEALSKEAVSEECGRGQVLFQAGDTDDDTIYLLSGEVRGDYPDGRVKTIQSDALQSRYPLGDLQPRKFTATVISLTATIVRLDRRFTEKVIAWDQLSKSETFKNYEPISDSNRWVFRLLQSKAIRKLPTGNIERMFTRFEEMPVDEGQTIIREGDDGDFFYVIKDGAASVSQSLEQGDSVVAYLVRGDSFGEDALLSNAPRNATVRMMKPGRLMRLSKADFGELLKQPLVEWVTPGKASIIVMQGGGIIDVRTQEEFGERAIKGAVNMPLARLREYAQALDKTKKYICYCNSGERSAAAAFVLSKMGIDAVSLQGGLSAMVKQMEKKTP
jgi:CRP-like cAMP-binding protein